VLVDDLSSATAQLAAVSGRDRFFSASCEDCFSGMYFLGAIWAFGAPSVEGGVEALDVLYGSGEAVVLIWPFPHPSLDGLAWKLWYAPSGCSRDRICVGSTWV
jgi:hypothetical protein